MKNENSKDSKVYRFKTVKITKMLIYNIFLKMCIFVSSSQYGRVDTEPLKKFLKLDSKHKHRPLVILIKIYIIKIFIYIIA